MKIIYAVLSVLNILVLSVLLVFGYKVYNEVQHGLEKLNEVKTYVSNVHLKVEEVLNKALDVNKKSELIKESLKKLKIGDAGPGDSGPSDE